MSMYPAIYRIEQWVVCHAQRLLPWPKPEVIQGKDAIYRIPDLLCRNQTKRVCVVTTGGTIRRGTLDLLLSRMREQQISCTIFDGVMPNPTITCIEEAVALYRDNDCQAIVAVGGGSVLDCAKILGARIVQPSKSIPRMKGMLRIRRKLPDFYAVPTTAGTGSEITVAAVVTDPDTHMKYAINDTCLLPKYAILEPELTRGLSPAMTAETGMDALTHAVEAYTNRYGEKKSRESAKTAVKLIFENLPRAYEDGNDMVARERMLKASFEAGKAFTKAYVGYVHAIAHALGGLYNVPHGLANAIILPNVMEEFGAAVYGQLSELAHEAGIHAGTRPEEAKAFIQQIRRMNQSMGIPDGFTGVKEGDISLLASRACKEANPAYPVPEIWNQEQMESVIRRMVQ